MTEDPHVVVDARMMHHAGIGVYIRNVVKRLPAWLPGWRMTALQPAGVPERIAPAIDVVPCVSDIYSIAEQFEVPRRTPQDATLFWSPHYNVPLFSRLQLVTTIHDVAHLARPERTGVAGALRAAYARTLLARVRSRSRAIIFGSEFTHSEFVRLVGPVTSSTTIHYGVDDSWRTLDRETSTRLHERPYVLFVGSVKPHKNVGGLIRAFGLIAGDVPHDLLIVGNHSGMRTTDSASVAAASGLGDRVRLLGRVDDSDLRSYVAHADALALPSFYEGFGLPPVEAMAAGCPCVVSNIPPIREACGDAALYCDPYRPEDIALQLRRVLTDDTARKDLIARGKRRTKDLTWDVTASRTAEVLSRAANDSPRAMV